MDIQGYRNQQRCHAQRKAAAKRHQMSSYRDGKGKHRVAISRAAAKMGQS